VQHPQQNADQQQQRKLLADVKLQRCKTTTTTKAKERQNKMAVKRKEPPAKTPAAKQSGGKRPPAPRHEDEEHGGGGGESKADLFDRTKAQGAIDGGKYVALIGEMVLPKADEKGQSARVVYEIASEGEFQGQKVTQFYKMFEADETVGKGLAFLKKDLAVLGYSDVKFGDLEQVFEEIVDKNVGCNVTVKQNGQFTNVYLNSLAEDSSVIDDYLAVRVF
jgi:hypothetical protein